MVYSGQKATPAEAEKWLGVSRVRINRWAFRGKLIRRGTMNGRPQYLVGDIVKLNQRAANDVRSTERKAVEV